MTRVKPPAIHRHSRESGNSDPWTMHRTPRPSGSCTRRGQAMTEIGRLLTAMITPFDAEGEVDYGQARKLAKGLVRSGSDGLVIGGTTGEAPSMTDEERLRLFGEVKDAVGNNAAVVAGTTDKQPPQVRRALPGSREGGGRLFASNSARLQQAPAGGAVPALQGHSRGHEPARHPLQRAHPHLAEHGGGDDAAAGRDRQHRWGPRRHRATTSRSPRSSTPPRTASTSGPATTTRPSRSCASGATASSASPQTSSATRSRR